MKDWHVFSTVDMVNWTDRGSPLSLKAFAWARHDAWAAQCIERAAHWGDIDPTVFIDDDGQAYLYWGNPWFYAIGVCG
jgi:arabinoxylan arabinofuranohydrolase